MRGSLSLVLRLRRPVSPWPPSGTLVSALCRRLLGSARSSSSSSSGGGSGSVAEAQRRIFGWWAPEGANATPFTALNRLRRRGWIGPKVMSYYPKPIPQMKHPIVRNALHEEWQKEMLEKRKLGKGPPPKGQGKRASRKR